MTTPNQDDKRSVRTLADLRALSEQPNDLPAIVAEFLQQCGACDIGMGGCTCATRDYRPTMSRLVDEVEASRKAIADVLALAEDWRYKGEFGWGAWQEGEGPDQEGWTLDHCSRAIRRAITDHITPDAPASEANGRPPHSSSTEQED